MAYPAIAKALEIYSDYMDEIRKTIKDSRAYDLHCIAVAYNAVTLASNIPEMSTEKAFILGLLHDYGELTSAIDKTAFHGTAGYDLMTAMGYDEVARICLTHTFPNPNFEVTEYVYPQQEILRAKSLISTMQYDDYDKLIQLSDALVRSYKNTTLRNRLIYVQEKYGISTRAMQKKYREALRLKRYFDKKCQDDIYNILGINDAEL